MHIKLEILIKGRFKAINRYFVEKELWKFARMRELHTMKTSDGGILAEFNLPDEEHLHIETIRDVLRQLQDKRIERMLIKVFPDSEIPDIIEGAREGYG